MQATLETIEECRPSQLFLRAGNAIFTVSNSSGDHYTYRIQSPGIDEDTPEQYRKPTWFVHLLTGPDNTTDYQYIGMYSPSRNAAWPTRASKIGADSKPFRVLNWALQIIANDAALPPGYSITRSTRCGRCGRSLTHPDGITDEGYRHGFGPICWDKLNGEA